MSSLIEGTAWVYIIKSDGKFSHKYGQTIKLSQFSNVNYGETLQKWYDKADTDASDIDNVSEGCENSIIIAPQNNMRVVVITRNR